jgi:type II secretory pathway component HofQ
LYFVTSPLLIPEEPRTTSHVLVKSDETSILLGIIWQGQVAEATGVTFWPAIPWTQGMDCDPHGD